MNSLPHGKDTSGVEVTNISAHGFWVLAHGKELFLPYAQFPWFRDQKVVAILEVEEIAPGHFHWPALDVDLTEEMIEHPERFPLSARTE